jgi:hypothetical protein
MKIHWGFILPVSLVASATFAQDLNIVDVRRNITLADDDVVYKDFYINGGESDGLKKNLVVTAFRKISVRDSSGSQTYGEINVPVGQLRIISTYGKVSVAREYKLLSRDELPMLEQVGLMSGDLIDLKGAFVDDKKPVYKKKSVAAAPPKANAMVAIVTSTSVGPAPASVAPAVPTKVPAVTDTPKTSPSNPAKTADAVPAKAQ